VEIYDEGQEKYIDVPRDRAKTWVPAAPEKRHAPMAYPMPPESAMPLAESHLASLETIRETATPIERSLGLAIRSMPFTVVWLVLCFGLMVAFDSDWPLPFLIFAVLTAVTYNALNRQEYTHSASGLERHKADLAHDLQARRIDNDHELRDKALDAYIRHLERDK
jgi:hypothetical protein